MSRFLTIVFAVLMPMTALGAPLHLRHRRSDARPARAAHTQDQYGLASWYGPGLQGLTTASGQRFDERQLTAAHRTLPLGTRVKVTNLKNGRSVTVRINDRGPWVYTRLIDLSRAAAVRLGFRSRGITPVKVTVLRASVQEEIAEPARESPRNTPGE